MSRKLITLNSILMVILALSLAYSHIQAAPTFNPLASSLGLPKNIAHLAGWNGHVWTDTFADNTGIVAEGATQVTDQVGGVFGASFAPYPGNPLSTLESIDPWDSNGDPRYQIPGAVHPDVQYFPDGMDGYKFWMIFTPLAFTPLPPGIPDPPNPGMKTDWWWERPTLVRSNDGINWVKTDDYSNPLVSAGVLGEWDDGWLADPDFVYAPGKGPHGESWFLYYTGCGSGGCAIALSLSQDGKHYTKYGTGPVSPAYRCPTVIYDSTADIFRMWYNWGGFDIGYATSPDGIDWTPYDRWGTIVYQGHPGTYDQGGVTHEDVVYFGGQYHMYYLALPTGAYAGLNIGHATSPDGITWTQSPTPAMVPGGESWMFWNTSIPATVQSFYRPSVVPVGDTLYMYYGGTDTYSAYPTIHYDLGLAFPSTADGHLELTKATDPAEYPTRAEDTLAWYHMNENPSPPQYPGEYVAKELTMAWYHFNEGIDSSTSDSSGNNNNGSLQNATWTPGLYNNALSFNGNNARVTVPYHSTLDTSQGITIEAWVNPSISKGNNYIVSKASSPNIADFNYGLKLENGYTGLSEIGGVISDQSGHLYFAYGGSIPSNQWTHVAMTYQVGDSQIRLFQNGVEVTYRYGTPGNATDTIPANTQIRTNNAPLNIGMLPYGSGLYYQGVMDELRIIGRALSATEIADDGTMVAVTPTVIDSSGNNNDGIPSSGVNWTNGRFSYGLQFNGTTGMVTVPHSPTLNPQAITIEAWVNPEVAKGNNYIVNKSSTGIGDFSYGLKLESTYTGHSEIGGIIGDPNGQLYFAYGGSVPSNQWTHVAMTYQEGDSQVRLYQNGIEVTYRFGAAGAATDTIPSGTQIRTNTAPLNIGMIPIGTNYFQGVIDELRILNTALTSGEIAHDYGSSYSSYGVVTSVLVTPPFGESWLSFDALESRPDLTTITYQILDVDGAILRDNVASGADISSIGNQSIRLRANLATSDPSKTPLLHSWSLTSQVMAEQTISFEAIPNKTYGDPDFPVNASASSGLPVSFVAAGNCTVDGNNVHITGAGSCTITAYQDGNENYNPAIPVQQSFEIARAATTTVVTCSVSEVYTGDPIEPCIASYSGVGGPSGSLPVTYANNLVVGTATASATYDGDANHEGSTGSGSFQITRAASSVTVTCPASQVYTGQPIEPCTASYSGVGGLSGSLPVTYANNLVVGTATASATYDGDANHFGSTGLGSFEITRAASSVTVTCPVSVVYTGSAQTPCTAKATGVGMSDVDVTASLVYSNNTNVGTATADASWDGDANHTGSDDSATFEITPASTTTLVTCPVSEVYTGQPIEPCTVSVTGANLSLTPDPVYADNINVGTATASYTYHGDVNHTGSSDSATFEITKALLTVTPDNWTGQYSDPNPAIFTFKYSGWVNDEGPSVLTTEPACTTTRIASSAPGTYDITCSGGVDDNYAFDYEVGDLTVTQEDARAYYTGALLFWGPSTTATSANVTLAATIKDITAVTDDPAYDANAGDIQNAKVTFLSDGIEIGTCKDLSVGLVSSDTKVGTVTCNAAFGIDTSGASEYTISIRIDGYYTRYSPTEDEVITVAKPLTSNFITGGGFLILSNSSGMKAGDAGTKASFGFHVKYNKSGTSLQGQVNIIFRRLEADGIVHVYQIKGNSLTSLGVNPKTCAQASPTAPCTATFFTKANIKDITDPLNPITIDGGATLQLTMTDKGEPGSSDTIGITLFRASNKGGGVWFSSNWNGTRTVEQILNGGNLVVH